MTKSNNKLRGILVAIALTAVIIIGVVLAVNYSQQPSTDSEQTATEQSAVVDQVEVIEYTATSEGSVLDQLQAYIDDVVIVESEMGSYVDSINGLAGGTDGKYWSLYVDGEMAQVGADQLMPSGGELVEWKFQKL